MIYFITHITDTLGNNYLGIDVSLDTVTPFLNKLKDILSLDNYNKYTTLQQNRDHGKYHITVVNVMEYNKLSKEIGIDKFVNSLEKIFDYEIDDLKMLGIGTASKNENRSYFIVCDSDKLNSIRDRYELPKQDFHITLGYNIRDVFGVRKNEVLKNIEPFLNILSTSYYNSNENFDFIKEIENYNGDIQDVIEPTNIGDTSITFRNGQDYFTVALIDDKLRVVAQWEDKSDNIIPTLSNTVVSRKLKK